jgi:hypothetical protein
MNANELADKLKLFWHTENDNLFEEAATMLRQQQAEIEVLKKFIAEGNALDKKLNESIQKNNEIWNRATNSILRKAQEK